MKITILTDNTALNDRFYLAEPALSIWIEDTDKTVLFDCGYSDVFLKNASAMGIDIVNVDIIALSHGHSDHSWGLIPLFQMYTRIGEEGKKMHRPQFISHPDAFCSREWSGVPEIGSLIGTDRLERFVNAEFTKEPRQISDNIIFLGEIPTIFPFEERKPYGTRITSSGPVPDYVPDDSALVCRTQEGLVIITGCSHSGICSIVERAKEVAGDTRVRDIIGGFHLFDATPDRLSQTICYLKETNPQELHPCHCTGNIARMAFCELMTLDEIGVGMVLEYL